MTHDQILSPMYASQHILGSAEFLPSKSFKLIARLSFELILLEKEIKLFIKAPKCSVIERGILLSFIYSLSLYLSFFHKFWMRSYVRCALFFISLLERIISGYQGTSLDRVSLLHL